MNVLQIAAILVMSQSRAKVTDLKDGFIRIDTPKYTVEIPKGWEIGEETSFGQRDFHSKDGELGTMTGSARGQSWDDLYRISLYFIQRAVPGTPTPYRIEKNQKGYDTMSFEMLSRDNAPVAKYVILKNKRDEILALSVRIPDQKASDMLNGAFKRLISTAVMK